MKRKLLGLLGILTLISGCSNVNQRSIDLEAKKINLIKKAISEEEYGDGLSEIGNLKVSSDERYYKDYSYKSGVDYRVYCNPDDGQFTFCVFNKKISKYGYEDEYAICIPYLKNSSSTDRAELEASDRVEGNRMDIIEYSLDFYIYKNIEILFFGDTTLSDGTNFSPMEIAKLKITRESLKDFDVIENRPVYLKFNPTVCEKTFALGEEEVEILSYDKLITSKIGSGKFILSKDFDCRDLLIRLAVKNNNDLDEFNGGYYKWDTFDGKLALPGDGIIGNINQIVIQKKSNTNYYMPYTMTINFDVVDKYSLEVAGTCQVVFYTVFFLEDIVYKFDNKELKKDDHINIGYGRKLKELYDVINHDTIRNYFSLIIDGKEYTNKSEELEKSFYELNLKSTSLLEIKIDKTKQIGPLYGNGYRTACYQEGTPYTSNVMELYLDFKDDINPVLNSEIKLYRTSKEENFKYKELFKAVDEKDNDVSDTLELLKEENKTYVTAKDKSGNVGKLEITLDVDPVLYENINVINDSIFEIPENVFITKNRVEKILAKIHSKEVKDLDMITYINNSKVKGEYKVTYKVDEENKELTFKVIDPIEEKVTLESFSDQANEFKDSFIGKVKTFFIKLGNWFRGVFTKWRFDCYIDSEEWDTRFN